MAGSALTGGGSGGGLRLPAKPLFDSSGNGLRSSGVWVQRGESAAVASPEVLDEARERAKKAEEDGLEAFRRSGAVPKGPPGLPIGTMVIEQKFVDFIIGPGGQSLAALNYAAGVTVHLDQSHAMAGYTVAHIYGPEDCVRRAKVALEFKISQWLPKGASYSAAAATAASAVAARPATAGVL